MSIASDFDQGFDESLLEQVSSYNYQQDGDDHFNICYDVIKFLEEERVNNAIAAIREANVDGETVLHILLKYVQCGEDTETENEIPIKTCSQRFTTDHGVAAGYCSDLLTVVKKFAEIDCDAFKTRDNLGRIPLHNACRRSCSFEVIRAVIEVYPAGLGVMCNCKKGANKNALALSHTPFGWDYAICVGGHFTEFLQYVVSVDVSATGCDENTRKTRLAQRGLLDHCKNWVPLDILRKGMLNKQTLESTAMIRWLNEVPCQKRIVCSFVFEFYLHIAWICTFIYTTRWYVNEDGQDFQGWGRMGPILLLVCAAIFFIQEIHEMCRFTMTNAGWDYWLDLWNWVDLATISLVTASAIQFIKHGHNCIDMNYKLLIATGFFQFILSISFLKKSFFAFSKFVSGVMKIGWILLPFLAVSVITAFAFSYMYYVRHQLPVELGSQNSTDPYETFWVSFNTVYSSLAGGPLEEHSIVLDWPLDYIFGIVIIIVLLNVLIAVVDGAWKDAEEEADKAFWHYRLELILGKTRGINGGGMFLTSFFGNLGGLDEFYYEHTTAGTTMVDVRRKLALAHKKEGALYCFFIIVKSLALVLLGFPTLGILWPRFFREVLFTPPKPKGDETKMRMKRIVADVNGCKSDIAALRNECKSDTARIRKEVELMSHKVDSQIELMQQILSKMGENGRGTEVVIAPSNTDHKF